VLTDYDNLQRVVPNLVVNEVVERYDGEANPAPKLVNVDGESIDVSVGNGSEVVVKIKPYKNDFGQFAELMAVKVENLVEYVEGNTDDNEEF
jgi:antitoxin component of MazEF toxin-antitoxin module